MAYHNDLNRWKPFLIYLMAYHNDLPIRKTTFNTLIMIYLNRHYF